MDKSNKSLSIDDFTLLRCIGKGTYGKVLLVRHNLTQEVLALKILKKDVVAKRKQIDHTKTERNVLEKMTHPFIVKLRYAFQTSSKLYMALEYCPGGELFFHLSKVGRFSEDQARFYSACCILAVEFLHQNGVVYRDLKPENVLIDQDGFAKLTDFGLSKDNLQGKQETSTFCGTPEYLAPEVIKRQSYGPLVDWWALGALLYEMLSGWPPFYSQDRQALFNNIVHAQIQFPRYFSPVAKDLILKLLTKDPLKRLGVQGCQEIKTHAFYASIDWEKLEQKQLQPPFIPVIDNQLQLPYVDEGFKQELPCDTPVIATNIVKENEFKGFTYTNSGYLEEDNESSSLQMQIENVPNQFQVANE